MNTLRSDGNTIHVEHDDQTLIAEIRCRGQEPFILTLPLSAAHLLREALSITAPSPGQMLRQFLDEQPALTTWTFEIPGDWPETETVRDPYESWHTDMATPEPTTTEGEPMNPWTCTITDNEADGHVSLTITRPATKEHLPFDDGRPAEGMVTVVEAIAGEQFVCAAGERSSIAESVKPLMVPLDVLDAIVDARLRDRDQHADKIPAVLTPGDTVIVNQLAPTAAPIDPFVREVLELERRRVREVLELERRRVNHALGIATKTDDDDTPF